MFVSTISAYVKVGHRRCRLNAVLEGGPNGNGKNDKASKFAFGSVWFAGIFVCKSRQKSPAISTLNSLDLKGPLLNCFSWNLSSCIACKLVNF